MGLSIEVQAVPAVHALLVALATWRVTHLLAAEDGPGNAVVRLRAWLGDSAAGRAMDCFYCLSLWVAAPLAAAVARDAITFVLLWLGASGAACLLERATAPRDSTNPERGDEP